VHHTCTFPGRWRWLMTSTNQGRSAMGGRYARPTHRRACWVYPESAGPASRRYIQPMETYTINPQDGLYAVEAISEDGTSRVVGTFPSEQVATAYLKRLQQKADSSHTSADAEVV
jgi:hypothetical protein